MIASIRGKKPHVYRVIILKQMADYTSGVSVENLPGRGFGVTCCTCVSFAWEIVRDSPMVNLDSQAMNKHIKMRLGHRRRSLLPGNAKCSMTSLADTKHIFRERKIYLFIYL